jgi:dienelactone hydrolase
MSYNEINYYDGETLLKGILIKSVKPNKSPAIILFHAFEGRSEFIINYGKKLANNGYTVFIADMYGNAETSNTIDGCFKLITPFLESRELVRRRALLAYETILKQDDIDKDSIGAMGFCFGGMCALEIVRSGANIKGTISVHGVLAKSKLKTHEIKSSILVIHGYKDPQVPPSELTSFAEELDSARTKDWIFTFIGDAKHSFTDPKTGTFEPEKEIQMGRVFNERAATRAYNYAIGFFDETLTL